MERFLKGRRAKFLISASLVFAMLGGAQVTADEKLVPPAEAPASPAPSDLPTPVPDQSPVPESSPDPLTDPSPSPSPTTVEEAVTPRVEQAVVNQLPIVPPVDPTPPVQVPRLPVSVDLSISGQRFTDCEQWNEVIFGRPYTVTSNIGATGIARLQLSKFGSGESVYYEQRDAVITGGQARWTLTAHEVGNFLIKAEYLGDELSLPSESAFIRLRIVVINWVGTGDGGVRLNVPWFRQQYALTCESGSLRSALAFVGIDTGGDIPIMERLGVDVRNRSGKYWGNPEEAFVGNFKGRMMRTGYGVHATPIARVATSYRPCNPATEVKSATDAEIAGYVNDGFPVQVWGAQRGGRPAKPVWWRSWDGGIVTAWDSEHTWLVVGFRGPASNPSHFIIHDPSRSRRGAANKELSLAQFHAFTKYFSSPYTSRVVVVR